ncbi:MFS transporter [Leifsonia sp. AG29]|uniref:MFS transporter n=1 Tax=Leifsonia sp. AG29 TaxID=2598860 RepID=UPI00131E8826|nr:hypothetical protein [Leifsonia sp. AG29]
MTRRGSERLTERPIADAGGGSRPVRGRQHATLVVAFVSLGAVASAVPASLPDAAARLGVGSEELLPAVSSLFFGLFLGVVIAVLPRASARTLLPVGLASEAVGLVLLAASGSVELFVASAAVGGVGFGIAEASATVLTRELSAAGTPARLTALNGASAVAAAATPLLIAVSGERSPLALLAIALVPACGAVLALLARRSWPAAVRRSRGAQGWRGLPRLRIAIIGVALFVFVGAETVLAGWSSLFTQTLFGVGAGAAPLGTAAFWVLMAVGRFVCSAVVGRGVRASTYLTVGVLAAALLAAACAVAGGPIASAALLSAVVLLVAPGYALLLGEALASLPSVTVGRVTATLVAVGSAGGSALTFAVAAAFGSAPSPVLFACAGLLAVCGVLSFALSRASLLLPGERIGD